MRTGSGRVLTGGNTELGNQRRVNTTSRRRRGGGDRWGIGAPDCEGSRRNAEERESRDSEDGGELHSDG